MASVRRAHHMARKLLEDLNERAPVNAERLAGLLGIQIFTRQDIDSPACLLLLEGTPVIVVKEGLRRPHRQWCIAHEIGHYLLHPPGDYDLEPREGA